MTLQQLATVKRWHQTHRRAGAVEYQLWDAMLTCWVMGWLGLPVALLLDSEASLLASVTLPWVPGAYVALRRRLHRQGLLRCDWLHSADPR